MSRVLQGSFFLYFMEVSRFLRVFQYCTDFQKKIFKGDLEQNPLDFSSEKYPIIQQNLFGYMSKLGLPYLPSRLIWTKISLDKYSYCLPYVPIQKVWKFLHWSLYLNIYLLTCVRILLVNNHVRYHQARKRSLPSPYLGFCKLL